MPLDSDQATNLDAELDALVSPTTIEVLQVTDDYEASVVAASAARRAMEGGGGSQPLSATRIPLAFDTPNLTVQSFAQVSADSGTSSFVIAGDHAAAFGAGSGLTSTSLLNSGFYTVVSATFSGGNTTIVVAEAVADEGADGSVINSANGLTGAGIDLYTPAAGEQLYIGISYLSVATAWDGTTPTLWIYQQGAVDYQNSITVFSGYDLSVPNVDEIGDGTITKALVLVSSGVLLLNGIAPLRAVVDDGSNGAPGSAQGSGEIVFWIGNA